MEMGKTPGSIARSSRGGLRYFVLKMKWWLGPRSRRKIIYRANFLKVGWSATKRERKKNTVSAGSGRYIREPENGALLLSREVSVLVKKRNSTDNVPQSRRVNQNQGRGSLCQKEIGPSASQNLLDSHCFFARHITFKNEPRGKGVEGKKIPYQHGCLPDKSRSLGLKRNRGGKVNSVMYSSQGKIVPGKRGTRKENSVTRGSCGRQKNKRQHNTQ